MCNYPTDRNLRHAAQWADKNKIDLTQWDGGLADFAEALRVQRRRPAVVVP